MTLPVIYGADYSTYVRTARLTFEEKPAEYRLEHVHFLAGEAQQPGHLRRHPFGKVPAFEHDGLTLYETDAIIRYVDQVFPGRRLQPDDPRRAARMNQIIGIIESYGWPSIIGKVVWQRLIVPMTEKREGDETIVRDGKPTATLCLSEIERIKGQDAFLAGPEISLADLFLAPIFTYLMMTPDAPELLKDCSGLQTWWAEISTRESMVRTQPKLG